MLREEVIEYLEELKGAGFDLRSGVAVEQYLRFPVASMAHGATEELRRAGYDVDLEPDEDDGGWVAYVTRTARPEVGDVVRMQEQAAALAGAHGGAYEGWNLVPPEQGDEVTHDVDWELPD
jgi:hypothetical protein